MREYNQEPSLRLRLFGPFEAEIQGSPLSRMRSRKHQQLLALLALRAGREVQRAWVAGTLWPDSSEPAAFNSLRQGLQDVRRALGPQAYRLQSPSTRALCLDLSPADVDVFAFAAAIGRGTRQDWEQAVGLYSGPLLEGWAEEWVVAERAQYEQMYFNALESLAEQLLVEAEPGRAAACLQVLIKTDPLRESAYRLLMRALAKQSNYAVIVQIYRDLRLQLMREMRTEPAAETTTLFHRLRDAGRAADQTSHAPSPLPPLAAGDQNNLPLALTSFVGREKEQSEVKALISRFRLVTLTGSGGCGKTRMALQVAADVWKEYVDGAWFVELASLTDASLVPQSVAQTLSVRERPGEPLTQTLVQALKERQALLLLDNCEHVLDAAASLAKVILQSCPGIKIFASSREALGIAGERVYRIPALSVPSVTVRGTPASLACSEAVRLFADRALAVQADFAVTVQNAPALASICRRLDGVPLAIELAAARVRALSVEEIDARLDNRFDLLTGGNRVALPRQQTLRALMEWSYGLLNVKQQALLCRLAVFGGGCRIEAAEQVCRGGDIRDREILDLLQSLVDKSLVVSENRAGKARYHLLETTREYAWERLEERGEAGSWRDAHVSYFLALAEEAASHLTGADAARWLQRLEEEHENFRSALAWSLSGTEAKQGTRRGLRLCGALPVFWWTRGYLSEGRRWCDQALAAPRADSPLFEKERVERERAERERASVLFGAGRLAWQQGDYAAASACLQTCQTIRREIRDKAGFAEALHNLGNVAYSQSEYALARAYYEEGLTIRREIRDQRGIAKSLTNLSNLAYYRGEFGAARAGLEEAVSLLRHSGDKMVIADTLNNLGFIALVQGDVPAARDCFEEGLKTYRELGARNIINTLIGMGNIELRQVNYDAALGYYGESLALCRETGDQSGAATALNNMGSVERLRGEYASARDCIAESLALFGKIGSPLGIINALEAFGGLAAAQKQTETALRLWGAAEAQREKMGLPLSPEEKATYECEVANARATQGATAMDAWAQGRSLTMEQAIAYALAKTGG